MSHPFYILPVSVMNQKSLNTSASNPVAKAAPAAEGGGAEAATEAAASSNDTKMLPRVVFLGRALRDYREMFDLEDFPAAFAGKKILDVGAGSATFAAEAAELGVEVTAVDPLYGLSVDALDRLSTQDQETSFAALVKHAQHYKADDAQLSHLRARREATRRQFIDDYRVGLALGRYRKAELPHLPFEDNVFDVALCGNFLFLYGHLFGLDFHLQAIDELLRVAPDVRIYPLVGLDSVPPPFAETLIERLQRRTDITTRRIEIKSSILSNRVEGLLLQKR